MCPLTLSLFFGIKMRLSCRYADVARAADAREKHVGARPFYTQDDDWPRNPTHYFWRTLIVQARQRLAADDCVAL